MELLEFLLAPFEELLQEILRLPFVLLLGGRPLQSDRFTILDLHSPAITHRNLRRARMVLRNSYGIIRTGAGVPRTDP